MTGGLGGGSSAEVEASAAEEEAILGCDGWLGSVEWDVVGSGQVRPDRGGTRAGRERDAVQAAAEVDWICR